MLYRLEDATFSTATLPPPLHDPSIIITQPTRLRLIWINYVNTVIIWNCAVKQRTFTLLRPYLYCAQRVHLLYRVTHSGFPAVFPRCTYVKRERWWTILYNIHYFKQLKYEDVYRYYNILQTLIIVQSAHTGWRRPKTVLIQKTDGLPAAYNTVYYSIICIYIYYMTDCNRLPNYISRYLI